MNKPNDFLAANLNAPDNFTLSDFYTYGLTPDNTGLKPKDSYKQIKQVQDAFKDDRGNFNDAAFDSFYDSVSRLYNDWAQTDFAKNIMSNIPRAREEISDINNTNIRNVDAELFSLNDPWRHQRGMGNVYTLGKESFDIREVAQANKVHDADGNELDYTANDVGLFKNPFKSLFGTPLVLAEDENGQPLLNKDGDPYYRELKKGESTYGKQVLHISDTLSKDDSWINKFDFFDNDGLDKSVMGTIMNTASRLAPYFIPYVGPVLGALDAAKGLATALPVLAKSVNGIITNDNDNNSFGKAMNSIEAYMGRFGTSKTRYAQEHNWAWENIGDMIATSAAQLYQQRTFSYIPWLLKMEDTEKATKIGQALSLSYMAATSAQDSLEDFKKAGLSDRAAGIATLAYASTLWRLMNKDYFKDQLFKNSWLNSSPEVRNILKKNNKEAARIAINSIQNAAKPSATKVLTQEEIKRESANLFKQISNALTEAWKNKSWSPIKGLDLVAPGSAFAEGNVYLNRALNEGIEEVMEENVLDILKVTSLGLESLGFNLKDETKEKIDYGLSVEDALQRYLTSFVGGAIGGAVFEGLDKYQSKVLNKDVSDYAGRGLNGELIRAIRNYGSEKVLGELKSLWSAGKLGSKNLGVKGRYVTDPTDKNKEVFVFEEGTDSNNQNNMMHNIMATRIKALDAAMHNLGIYGKDNEIMNNIVSNIEEEAKKQGMKTEDYMRKNKRDAFSEFVQKTGFADIILNDIGNLEIDAVEYDTKIEAEKEKIRAKYGDSDKASAEEEINKSKIIKEWTKKRDEALKLREDIISGKASAQYIKYANFAAHGDYVAKLLGKDEDKSVLDVASYVWAKYHVTYDSLSDSAKASMNEDYTNYQKLNGIDALYAANSLFQNVSSLVAPVIKNATDEYKDYNRVKDLSEFVLGEQYDDPSTIDPRIILNRVYRNDYHQIVDELLNPDKVTPQSINKLLNSIGNYYKYISDNKIVAEYGDDWVEYALSKLYDTLVDGFDINTTDANFKSSLESSKFKENEKLMESDSVDDITFNEALSYNTDYDNIEPLHARADIRSRFINQIRAIIPNIVSDPDTALEQIEDLREVIDSEVRQPELRQQVKDTLTKNLENLALKIKAINEARANTVHSPVIELAQLISYELNGTEIPILDEIAKQKASLASKASVSEYMITSDSDRLQLEAAKRIMPIIEVVLDSALNSNEYVNEFLDESEKLPEIDLGLYSLFVDDFHFLKSKIDYLLYLNDLNKNAKVREHINVRKYFYRNVIHRLIDNPTIDGEKNPLIDRLSKSMKDIDFEQLWNQSGGTNLDLESDDPKVQVEVMKAFATFEHLIREHIRTNTANYFELGKDIASSFDDAYKMKNGILSSNKDDDIDNFDLMTYLLTVVGTDSYEFGRKIKSKFEGNDKFPFFGQELAIRFAYLGINNPELINGAIAGIDESTEEAVENHIITDVDSNGKTLEEVAKNSKLYLSDKAKLWNTVVIDGFAGVGKSTVIVKTALELSDVEAIAVSKDFDRATALGSQFSADKDHIYSLDQFLTAILGKDYISNEWVAPFRTHSAKLKSTTNPKSDEDAETKYEPIKTDATYKRVRKDDSKKLVVVIDECTQLSEAEWQILTDLAKAEGVTIIGLGNTMQTGAVVKSDTGKFNSVNLDDCKYISTSKLTISMRTANAGKNENNISVGALAKVASDLQKDNPTYPISILSKDPKLDQDIKLVYNDDNSRVSGDKIVASIDDALIDDVVNASQEDESIVIITPNDSDFSASRAKYGSLTTSTGKPKVVFVKEDLVGGAEYDFAIINVDFEDNKDNKLLDIKRFYTLMTRAKKGSIIKNSNGLKNSLKVTSVPSATASAKVEFEPSSEVAKQYKSTRLEALNAIPAETTDAIEPLPEPEEIKDERIDDSDLSKFENGKDKVTVEKVLEEVDSDASTEDIEKTDDESDLTDYWITAGNVRGYKAEQYAKRKHIISSRDSNVVDADKFADWLVDSNLNLPYSPLNTDNDVSVNEYRSVIKILSSIFLNISKPGDRSNAFTNRLFSKLNQNRSIYKSGFIDELTKSIEGQTGVFFLQKIKDSDTEMMVYYCFGGKYAIPISIINLAQTESNIERFYKDIKFNRQTSIIPISSNGSRRSKVSDTIGNFVSVASVEDSPITAIFTPSEEVSLKIKNNRKNKYFLDNKGKAFIGLTTESGLTPDEARSLWNVQTKDDEIEYLLQDSSGGFAIAGVQEDIDAAKFFKILEIIRTLTSSNVHSDANDINIQTTADFFNVDIETVKKDFDFIVHNDPNATAKENAKRFGKIRSKYNILYKREIELMTSAIIQYCVDHDSQALEYITENLYYQIGPKYTNSNNGELIRTGGFRITAYDDKLKSRRFEIIPDPKLTEFKIYDSGSNGIRLESEDAIGTISADSFITNERVDHRKLISAAWEVIFKNTDIGSKTAFSKDLRVEKLADVDNLIRTGKLSFSLTTESKSEEDGNVYKYFSPFESKLLELVSYPKSLNKSGRFIDDSSFMKLLKNSSIFTYGLYKQIQAKDNIGDNDIWRSGNVGFENLTWDIVKVLAPVYSISATSITPDNDSVNSEGKYFEIYSSLKTNQTTDASNINVIARGNTLILSPALRVDDSKRWDDAFGEKAKSFVNEGYILQNIVVSQDNIICQFKKENGGNKNVTITKEQLEKLLQDIKHPDINTLSNGKILATSEGINFIGSNNAPKISKDGSKPEIIKFAALNKEGDDYFLYIQSETLGETKVKIPDNYDGISEFINSLRKVYNKLGNYIGVTEDGYKIFHKNGMIVTVKSDEEESTYFIKGVTDHSLIIMSNDGITNEVVVNPKFITDNFKLDVITPTQGDPKMLKYNGNIKVVGGTFEISGTFASTISNYEGDKAELTEIDLNNNTITLNGNKYNLNPYITDKTIDAWFSHLYVDGLLSLKTKKKIKTAFKDIANKLIDFDLLLETLEPENLESGINDYLRNHILALDGIYSISITNNGSIYLNKDCSPNAAVILAILKRNGDININDIPEKIIDSQSILKSPEFSVTLANNSVVNGTIQRIDGEWKVEFTTKGDTSIETLYDKLNEYERNGELSDQDIEYFKYRLNQIKNKTAPNPQYTLYSIQLMSRIKANPESAESRFYRELTNYNEKCNI